MTIFCTKASAQRLPEHHLYLQAPGEPRMDDPAFTLDPKNLRDFTHVVAPKEPAHT